MAWNEWMNESGFVWLTCVNILYNKHEDDSQVFFFVQE